MNIPLNIDKYPIILITLVFDRCIRPKHTNFRNRMDSHITHTHTHKHGGINPQKLTLDIFEHTGLRFIWKLTYR